MDSPIKVKIMTDNKELKLLKALEGFKQEPNGENTSPKD